MGLTKLEKTILDTISYYEGTIGKSANGYDILFGGKKIMNGWTVDTTEIRHRCIYPKGSVDKEKIEKEGFSVCEDPTWKDTFTKNGETKSSTAAGRYQYLGYSWASATEKLNLGFNAPMTKENQNKAALRGVKQKRKVTETELKNALTSLSNFKIVLEKLKNEWTSMKGALSGSYHKTVEQGWEFYKGAYEKYNSGGGTNTNTVVNGSNTVYVDSNGQTVSKFGTTTISSNGDNSKFYLNIPSGNPTKVIYFWAGLESVISREKQWEQIPQAVKNKCYIVMAAGTTASNQNSLSTLKGIFKKYNNSINVTPLKQYLMGYSAGGVSVFNNYDSSFEFVGLMDPSLSTEANTENRTYSGNVAMIWGSDGMTSITGWGVRYPKVQDKIKDGKGYSIKEPKLNHGIAIQKWFGLWGDVITTGQASTTNQSSSNCATDPNANYLRSVIASLGYKEKFYIPEYVYNSGNKSKKQVPTLNPNTGCYAHKYDGKWYEGELSNGGDMSEEISKVAAKVFTIIKSKYPSYQLTLTAGNDKFHYTRSYNSRHKAGNGVDMVIDGSSNSGGSNCATNESWGRASKNKKAWNVSKNGTKVQNVVEIIRGLSASGSGGDIYDKLRYIDEYCNKSAPNVGDHIHFSWGTGSEAKKTVKKAKSEADKNPSQLETFNVGDLFT